MKSLASSKFHRTSFQNERFLRGFLEISQNKLPKRAFRARLPQNFTEQASKTSVSCEASSKFHRTSFQNERFVRGFLEISQKQASKTGVSCDASEISQTKLPKRTFRARLPRNFKEQASKTNVSCEASSKFSQNKLPKRAFRARLPPNFIEQSFQNQRFARGFLKIL